MAYTFSEHIHRYAVWTAARAVQRNFTTTAIIQAAIENSGLPKFSENLPASQDDFDKWHANTAHELVGILGCSYGRAAKIIAIYLKTVWVIRKPEDDPVSAVIHPPIDRILLQNLSKSEEFKNLQELATENWTSFKEDDYEKIMTRIRNAEAPFNWKLEKYWKP